MSSDRPEGRGVNDEEILETARLAGKWYLDRRERLEAYGNEPIALLWLAVGEIEAIIDGFQALDAAGLLTLEDRVLRDDLAELIDGSRLDLEDGLR